MKAFLINRDLSITEYEGPPSGWMDPELEWDVTDIDEKHDVYFQDNAMEDINVIFIRLGKNPNIPLPAFVVGRNGENIDEPNMTISNLQNLIG